MKIIFLPEVLEYFNELTDILYEKGYFGLEENALQYVNDLILEIQTILPNRQKKPAPPYFDQYGANMYYIAIRKNKRTQWYIFFTVYKDKNDNVYLIRHISNNHVAAHYL